MKISRRVFLEYCTAASAALGVGPGELASLSRVLAASAGPSVLWMQGSGCSGCTVSFLNYISPAAPRDATDVLISSVRLLYHPTLSAAAGSMAVAAISQAKEFILIVEGGVPTAFDGHACAAWMENGREVTFRDAIQTLGAKASQIVCVGACAAYGGVSSMGANPAGVGGVQKVVGRKTINVAGCPPHPNWIVGTLIPLLQGKTVDVDEYGRPTAFFGQTLCHQCPFHHQGEARRLGVGGQCLEELACRGRGAAGTCSVLKWNNGVNWCAGAGAPCQACTDPAFPDSRGEGRGRGRGGPPSRRGFQREF